jgi:hypothetical protein
MTTGQAKDAAHLAVVKPILRDRIEQVLKRFNYPKMSELMCLTNWRWSRYPGRDAVPSAVELRRAAGELFDMVLKWWLDHPWQTGRCSSGGFSANIDPDGYPALVFEIMAAETTPSGVFGSGSADTLVSVIGVGSEHSEF